MKKYSCTILALFVVMAISGQAVAKGASQFLDEIKKACPSAQHNRAFEVAAEELDLSKVRCFPVLMQGGIPAQRAAFFISWGDYDYRGTNVDLETDKVTTRRGSVYAFLKKGDVLALDDVTAMGRKLYFKLITPEVYVPENREKEKRHSRLTLTLIFKLPKDVRESQDATKALELIQKWIMPFQTIEEAKSFAATTLGVAQPAAVQGTQDTKASEKEKKDKKQK